MIVCLTWLWSPLKAWRRRRNERAIRAFRLQREQLEAQFFRRAGSLGKPRGLRWLECDWLDSVTFGRDVNSGMLTAFVAVNIRFEAIEDLDQQCRIDRRVLDRAAARQLAQASNCCIRHRFRGKALRI